ncbi:negative acting factor [Fusarium austroafricanum]|uniref:Negative acting factor n=1 Tax=Fusarium austroafricanum TaxID=2364996 RepID=A0A8H4P1Q3_9HYPO|nr:negative acting factor [Fusarium austroafricanum]
MAQDDHGQSHGDSPNNPTVSASASAPTSTSPSLAPIVASVTAPPASTTSAGPVNPAASDTTLPPITELASVPFTPADRPTASTTAPVPTAAPAASSESEPLAVSSSAPTFTPASVPAASAAPPAISQQNGDSRAPEAASTTPAHNSEMSNQHPGLPHGHPASYPGSSAAYASSAGPTTAQYGPYPVVTSQPSEPYRPSPMSVGVNMSLPSMRTIESPHGPSVSNPQGMPMNMHMAPAPGGVPFYGHQGMPMAAGYGLSDSMARYALPHDPRLLGHRGPKKCDETHPTCNNCKKSKRECLGYDPIFRQQAGGQSSSNIQPAPSQRTPPTVPSSVPSTVPSSIAPNPVLTARPTNSYGSQPSMLPSSYATAHATTASPNPSVTSLSYDSSFSNVASPPVKSESTYEYPSAIDPALQGFSASSNAESSRAVEQRPLPDNNQHLRANKMKIDEIIDLLGSVPPPQSVPHTEASQNEITKVYHEMYAPGLISFFESTWYYFMENGQMSFPRNQRLVELLASFLKALEAVRVNDHTQMAYSGILETRLVWELARAAYEPPAAASAIGATTLPRDGDPKETQNRVRVVEALLCGDYLPSNPLCPPIQDADNLRTRQFDFWYSLAEFVRTREDPNAAPAVKVREDMLTRMRYLLDGRENRDVLYSIAVVRQLAPHFDAPYGNAAPQHVDETDPKNRLAVASKFIYDESQVTGGTTNVVRRISDIAHRAFVNPGVNIARRA